MVGTETDEENEKVDSATLNALLPTEVITDAMAKELPVELKGCSEQWNTGSVHYAEGEPDNWLVRGTGCWCSFVPTFLPWNGRQPLK